jgi:hypothetical protein
VYSPELLQVMRWCLMLDPLARPQSVFSLQRALQQEARAPAPATMPEQGHALGRISRRLRSLFSSRPADEAAAIDDDTR